MLILFLYFLSFVPGFDHLLLMGCAQSWSHGAGILSLLFSPSKAGDICDGGYENNFDMKAPDHDKLFGSALPTQTQLVHKFARTGNFGYKTFRELDQKLQTVYSIHSR